MRSRLQQLSAALACVFLFTSGCEYARGVLSDLRPPIITREGTKLELSEAILNRGYPAGAPIEGSLDIEIVRVGNAIRLENRTVYAYENVELWLNQQYGASVNLIAIGRSDLLALKSFVNRDQEAYPVARFLAPDADRPLVSAELLIDGRLYKLNVWLEKNWRDY